MNKSNFQLKFDFIDISDMSDVDLSNYLIYIIIHFCKSHVHARRLFA